MHFIHSCLTAGIVICVLFTLVLRRAGIVICVCYKVEVGMGRLFSTQPNPTQLTLNPTQPNPTHGFVWDIIYPSMKCWKFYDLSARFIHMNILFVVNL
jgi:hypothetical protein